MVNHNFKIKEEWGEVYIKHKLPNGQTIEMNFSEYIYTPDVKSWWVSLSVYSKRKHKDRNENLVLTTGKNPWANISTIRDMFDTLEDYIVNGSNQTQLIVISWVDNRRRNAYYKYLSRKGYNYMMYYGFKVIGKLFKKGHDNEF